MPIKSLRNRITDLASGEILGETTEEKQRRELEEKQRQTKPKKEEVQRERKKREPKKREPKQRKPREPKPEERKVSRESLFKRKELEEVKQDDPNVELEEEKEIDATEIVKEAVEGYEDVLSILNIKEHIDIDADFESKDLDYVEFSQTTPLGFDFDEVTDFISRIKYILSKYESALKQRNKELVIVASEVKKVEKRMMDQAQEKELEKMIGGMTEEERLIEENMNLKIRINELESRVLEGGDSDLIAQLRSQNDALLAENQILMRGQMGHQSKLPDSKLPDNVQDEYSPLPTFNNPKDDADSPLPTFNVPKNIEMQAYDEEDDDDFLDDLMNEGDNKKEAKDNFDSMVQSIGGEYDE